MSMSNSNMEIISDSPSANLVHYSDNHPRPHPYVTSRRLEKNKYRNHQEPVGYLQSFASGPNGPTNPDPTVKQLEKEVSRVSEFTYEIARDVAVLKEAQNMPAEVHLIPPRTRMSNWVQLMINQQNQKISAQAQMISVQAQIISDQGQKISVQAQIISDQGQKILTIDQMMSDQDQRLSALENKMLSLKDFPAQF